MKHIPKTSFFYLKSLCLLAIAAVIAFTCISCAKKIPQEQLIIKLSNIDPQVNEDAFNTIAQEYTAAHLDLSVQIITDTTPLEQFKTNPSATMANTDVFLFPSLVLDTLRSQTQSFYPISDIGFSPYAAFANLYTTPKGYWAVPLTVDPIICLFRKEAIQMSGDNTFPANWSSVRLISNALLERDHPLPHIFFYTQTGQSLADSIAAVQFAYGYQKDAVKNKPEMTTYDQTYFIKKLMRSTAALKSYMIADEDLTTLPAVQSLTDFLASPSSMMTFTRLSSYLKLADAERAQLLAGPVPTEGTVMTPCYAVAACIPLESKNPSRAEEFVRYLIQKMPDAAQKSGTISAKEGETSSPVKLPKDSLFILRTNSSSFDAASLLNLINAKTPIMKANKEWEAGYAIPNVTP